MVVQLPPSLRALPSAMHAQHVYMTVNASSKIQALVTSENCLNCACYLF